MSEIDNPAPPSFVRALGEACEAAVRQGIPATEALARCAFALDTHYATAGLPTTLDPGDRFAVTLRLKGGPDDR